MQQHNESRVRHNAAEHLNVLSAWRCVVARGRLKMDRTYGTNRTCAGRPIPLVPCVP